jgi:hypothetical protein
MVRPIILGRFGSVDGGSVDRCFLDHWWQILRGIKGQVNEREQWRWRSYRHYATGEKGPVLVNETQKAELRVRKIA